MRLTPKLNEDLASKFRHFRICDLGDSGIWPHIRALVASHSQSSGCCLGKAILSGEFFNVGLCTVLPTAVLDECGEDIHKSLPSHCLDTERCDDDVFVERLI